MERVNTIPYTQYIEEVNTIWGSRLFGDPQSVGKDKLHRHVWHPRLRRRIHRETSISLAPTLGSDGREQSSEKESRSKERASEESGIASLEALQKAYSAGKGE